MERQTVRLLRGLRWAVALTTPPVRSHAEALTSGMKRAGVSVVIGETPERGRGAADVEAASVGTRAGDAGGVVEQAAASWI